MRIDRIKLAVAMAKRDVTQAQLAEKAGISRGTVSYIHCGKSCSNDIGVKIAKALNVSIDELIEKEF
ncbi:MAG: helix-turn-helix transcriptional regulator [Ruminococcus sp.]|nr:helix-turn-helix transcriptional regulator [Ruminococcus sp.]